MKHFTAIIIFMLFTAILDAAYLKTIRIGAFSKKVDAQRELKKLNAFVQKHENILELQKKWDFEVKTRKSGKYHAILVEPLRNKKVLQEVLDTLRLGYKDAYVTTLKKETIKKKKIIKEKIVIPEVVIPEVIEIKTPLVEIEEEKIIEEETTQIIPLAIIKEDIPLEKKEEVEIEKIQLKKDIKLENEIKAKPPVKVEKTVQEEYKEQKILKAKEVNKFTKTSSPSQKSYLWEILLFVVIVILLVTIRKLLAYKKENELHIKQNKISSEKIEIMSQQDENINKFLSYINHEIRSPISAIDGMTQLMLDQGLSKFEEDYAKRIKNSASNLLDIMDDTLDMSKIQSGELQINYNEFNINDTINYVLTTILAKARQTGTKVSFDMDSSIPSHIIGDSLRLSQVLINLLSNMMQCSENKDIYLNIKKLANYGDTLQLKFIISNHNDVSEEEANLMLSEELEKMGLSVLISAQLIEMMEGEIFVNSQEESCSVIMFTVVFTLKDTSEKRQYRLPSKKLLNKTVLIVDAHEQNVVSLGKYLEYFHYKIHSIPSFEATLAEDKMEFDLIIANQSNLNSASIRKLKEIATKNTKIVVMSELYKNIQHNFFQDIDIEACIKTPFTQQNILEMIIQLYVSKDLDKTSIKYKLNKYAGKKILIAEDNELTHKVISDFLFDTGIELTFVRNGKEAVDLVNANEMFDLILMDIQMPLLNGYKASEEIRKNNKNNKTHILALTVESSDAIIEKIFASGMQGHISKPIEEDLFYKNIYNVLNNLDEIINIMSISRDSEYDTAEEFSELSVSSGLSKSNNNESVYKTTLADFKAMYMNSPSVLEQLIQDKYFTEAKSLAIDVKEIALNIGAYNLAENTAAMVHEFEMDTKENYSKIIDVYRLSLKKLFSDVDKYLKST